MNTDNRDFLLEEIEALDLDVPPMPEGFHEGWMKKVEDDMANKQLRKPWGAAAARILSAAAAVVFVVCGSLAAQDSLDFGAGSISGGGNSSGQYTRSYQAVEESYDAYDGGDLERAAYGSNTVMLASAKNTNAAPAWQEKKIIRTASMTIVTMDWERSYELLRTLCTDMGGWIASASESAASSGLRTAYMTLRVPSDKLDALLESGSGAGRVTRRDESATDVTESYRDTQARLETQKALMARLQALVTDAASLTELLELEEQIADTQYTIDSLTSSLQATDRQVDYATVDITLREERPSAVTEEDISLWQRLGLAAEAGLRAFGALMENLVIFVVTAWPFAGLALAAWFVVRWISCKIRKRRNS